MEEIVYLTNKLILLVNDITDNGPIIDDENVKEILKNNLKDIRIIIRQNMNYIASNAKNYDINNDGTIILKK
jgi:hypothetical protein